MSIPTRIKIDYFYKFTKFKPWIEKQRLENYTKPVLNPDLLTLPSIILKLNMDFKQQSTHHTMFNRKIYSILFSSALQDSCSFFISFGKHRKHLLPVLSALKLTSSAATTIFLVLYVLKSFLFLKKVPFVLTAPSQL